MMLDNNKKEDEKKDDPASNNNHNSPSATTKEDAFYDIVRQRVYQALQNQGFDPIQQRAANVPRVVYYFGIATGAISSFLFIAFSSGVRSMGRTDTKIAAAVIFCDVYSSSRRGL